MSGSPDTTHGRRWFRRLVWLALALALPASALLVWRERAAKPPLPTLGRVPSFSLLERDGSTVRREDLAGRPWVADFIFTRCVLSCPRLTAEMKRLRERLPDREAVRLVSLSVDPEHDRPEVLAEYAARHGIAPDDRGWLFLTGEHDPVWALIREGFRVAVSRPEPGPLANPLEPIVHSTHFVLVDATGEIRGYYSAFDEEAVNRLLADLARLLATAPRR
ncbi:MAG: SCO family protein [Thermoanaerobaculia bacterium]|nr:SCO family protein [Thermoanaerobaculia bacterium]